MKKLRFTFLYIILYMVLTSCSQLRVDDISLAHTESNTNSSESTSTQEAKIQVSSTENNEDKVISYLYDAIPEIKEFESQISKASKGQVGLSMRIDNVPGDSSDEPFSRYYIVYVGENHPDHTVRWNSFYIREDLNEILIEDIVTGEVISLGQWRELYKDRGY